MSISELYTNILNYEFKIKEVIKNKSMKLSEIHMNILGLELKISHYEDLIRREIFNVIADILSTYKEFEIYENDFYKWLKSYNQKSPINIYQSIKQKSTSSDDFVKLHIINNSSGWDESTNIVTIPTKLIKLINEQF